MANKGQIGVTTENIFPVIKQFLYSDHEIFLRELVANAVDATQKMKALAASGDCKEELGELKVRLELDAKIFYVTLCVKMDTVSFGTALGIRLVKYVIL